MITQLRDVRAAGESAEMAVKDHQEPLTPVLVELVADSPAVAEIERYGGFARQILQGGLLPVRMTPDESAPGGRCHQAFTSMSGWRKVPEKLTCGIRTQG